MKIDIALAIIEEETMAVTRIQSIKANNIEHALEHVISPPKEEEVVSIRYPTIGIQSSHEAEVIKGMFKDILELPSPLHKRVSEIFKCIESVLYTRKIRKNAVIQEIVISYQPNDFEEYERNKIISEIEEDINVFLDAFKSKFGFSPLSFAAIHYTQDKNLYHVHIFFSLMNPFEKRKARWRKRDYFALVDKMRLFSRRISPINENKGIGAYPLWLIKKLESIIGRELAQKVIQVCRKMEFPTPELYVLVEDFEKGDEDLRDFLKYCKIIPENEIDSFIEELRARKKNSYDKDIK